MTKENFMANRYNSLSWTFFLFLLFFFFLTGNSIYWRAWLRREQSSWVQGPPFVQGTTIRDVFGPTAIWVMSRFSTTMFSNSSALNLVNPHFLEVWIFWWPGNLNLALQSASITCSLFCSLVRMDIMSWPMWTLATVPWGSPKAPRIPVWSLDWETAGQSWMPTRKSCLQGPLGLPVQATGCIHYQGGCCLHPLHTGPPWGKEHSRLNWLQKYIHFKKPLKWD